MSPVTYRAKRLAHEILSDGPLGHQQWAERLTARLRIRIRQLLGKKASEQEQENLFLDVLQSIGSGLRPESLRLLTAEEFLRLARRVACELACEAM